eukprot:TRINITY_DN65948_c7_g2_i1.p1 TRINITY_DN65948_c7_g2~~TRINITY_DN65948_c7_g2_i1.p1  ORF type:complete len:391 (-),score=39.45 TRINITY_DN65948_c7_g2_i1:135-1181(-)
MFEQNHAARCIDGTAFGYYFQPGTGSGRASYFVYHKGGGWCESVEDCYQRSSTDLGSSKKWDRPTMKVDDDYFSINKADNPLMWNWNKIWIPYCDGGSFSGFNFSTTMYKGKALHFRGHANVMAVIDDVREKMKHATNVVIGGSSAGGLAAYLHVDLWRQHIPKSAKVVGLPDSGFFLDYEDVSDEDRAILRSTRPGNYHNGLHWVFYYMNSTEGVDADCIAHWGARNESSKCMFAQHTAPFITTPTFALQSQYDSWQLGHELKQPFTDAQANHYGAMVRRAFNRTFLTHMRNGAHFGSCYHHTRRWDKMHIKGDTPAMAFSKWFAGEPEKSPRWIENRKYPCHKCCN